jgi:hypothetical protein
MLFPPKHHPTSNELAGSPPFEDDTYHFDCAVRLDVGDDHKRLPNGQLRDDVVFKWVDRL